MKRIVLIGLLTMLATALSGCNGVSNNAKSNPSPADLAGSWEIVATSTTNSGVATVIDATLSGVAGTNNSFTGPGISFQSQPTFDPYDCESVWIDNQNDPLTLTTTASQVTGTFTDGNAVFNFIGQTSGIGTTQAQFSGTYTSAAGNSTACQGSGTFVGTYIANLPVSLAGNYAGSSGYLTGTTLSVTQNGRSITAVLSGAGTYSGADTLNVNTAIVSDGSDILTLWWDASTSTLWVWSQADGASGFTKQ